ncbi:GntR family transcriptional regulator [Ureibacillus chungkukjangi]|uniref:GntR family transcriptional regulator n=1 Tax=Ureibacillus chungkukjangi TaxID=1202712 RepID=A0A318TZR5_9BACL|nr:GntR family transcriptional regulator [Ureibacillus chungkukjangi]MCM3389373.1 GntR family transcriptional regulator [Ureibacillus chungkukjangi]PYF05139.1 GntR family transcriptional regulator [Ureibacillus chungkukjangi]
MVIEKEHGEKSDYAYNLIKEKIFSWEYGPGQKLNVSKMSKEMEISPIPLREALSRLQSSKLVILIPNKGYHVTDILDEVSMKKMSEFRLLLESEAIKNIIRNNKMECIVNLENINMKIEQIKITNYREILDFNNLDNMFHLELIKNSENNFLIESFESLFCHLHIARFYYRRGAVDQQETVREHERIIKSIQMRDMDYALEFIKEHILGASNRLLEKDPNKSF